MSNLKEYTKLHNDRYVLGRVLGVGGFGITYAAVDNYSGTDVAIKEYMPTKLAERNGTSVVVRRGAESDFADGYSRFKTEWSMLSTLTNIKSIVRATDFFQENNTSYLVMELLSGEDIKALLDKIPREEILPFCEIVVNRIGAALVEVHNRGIIHLDVSPANIFFQSDGSITLIDFGSAVYTNGDDLDTVQLKHGFAPPELYNMKSPKGPWTDVYALAATYYNLVSGSRVSPAHMRLQSDDLIPLNRLRSDIPAHISNSIHKALSLDLNSRYRTVLEFLSDFSYNTQTVSEPVREEFTPQYDSAWRMDATDNSPTPRQEREEAPPVNDFFGGSPRNNPAPFVPRESNDAADVLNRIGKFIASVTPRVQLPASPVKSLVESLPSPMLTAYSSRYGAISIRLQPGTTYKLGRVSGFQYSDFVVSDDLRISKVHLHIRYDYLRRAFIVTDYSANGTFFADMQRMARGVEHPIPPNSVIYLASHECSIELRLS